MAAMLSKFRIDYSDVIVITDITKKPQQSTREYFNSMTKKFVETDGNTGTNNFVIVVVSIVLHIYSDYWVLL